MSLLSPSRPARRTREEVLTTPRRTGRPETYWRASNAHEDSDEPPRSGGFLARARSLRQDAGGEDALGDGESPYVYSASFNPRPQIEKFPQTLDHAKASLSRLHARLPELRRESERFKSRPGSRGQYLSLGADSPIGSSSALSVDDNGAAGSEDAASSLDERDVLAQLLEQREHDLATAAELGTYLLGVNTRLSEELLTVKEQNDELEETVKNVRAELESTQEEVQLARKRGKERALQVTDSEDRAQELQDALQDSRKKVAELSAIILQHEKEIASLHDEKKTLITSLAEAGPRHGSETSPAKNNADASYIVSLEQENKKLRNECVRVALLESRNGSLKAQAMQDQETITVLKTRLEDESLTKMKAQVEKMRKQHKDDFDALRESRREIARLKDQLKKSEGVGVQRRPSRKNSLFSEINMASPGSGPDGAATSASDPTMTPGNTGTPQSARRPPLSASSSSVHPVSGTPVAFGTPSSKDRNESEQGGSDAAGTRASPAGANDDEANSSLYMTPDAGEKAGSTDRGRRGEKGTLLDASVDSLGFESPRTPVPPQERGHEPRVGTPGVKPHDLVGQPVKSYEASYTSLLNYLAEVFSRIRNADLRKVAESQAASSPALTRPGSVTRVSAPDSPVIPADGMARRSECETDGEEMTRVVDAATRKAHEVLEGRNQRHEADVNEIVNRSRQQLDATKTDIRSYLSKEPHPLAKVCLELLLENIDSKLTIHDYSHHAAELALARLRGWAGKYAPYHSQQGPQQQPEVKKKKRGFFRRRKK